MRMTDLIGPKQVIADLDANDKDQLLEQLARRAAPALEVDAQTIFAALQAREKLGSTGIGQGVAIPHARVPSRRLYCQFARLPRAIDFLAVDEQPVDLVFLLLIPENGDREHLSALACASRRLRDKAVAAGLRSAKDGGELYERLVGPTEPTTGGA